MVTSYVRPTICKYSLRYVHLIFVTFLKIILAVNYLDVTIVNRYEKDVKIITTHSNSSYKRFTIPFSGSYRIVSASAKNERIYITAYDATSFFPVPIQGKSAISVSSTSKPVRHTYFIPSGELALDQEYQLGTKVLV